jgi:response regulator RpfG family c-di-GMP phosphodiesterase
MASPLLVADDVGYCYEEVEAIIGGGRVKLSRATTMEECVEMARELNPSAIVVYAAMKRAFSLLRMLKHSTDLTAVPVVVVGEPDQENLIAKHRRLPSRADRYLLRPLDPELLKSVIEEFLGTHPGLEIPPLEEALSFDEKYDAPPDAYQKMEEELGLYRQRVEQLERDLEDLHKSSKELAKLNDENQSLKSELEKAQSNTPSTEFADLFARLEVGYKDTIYDLEKLIQEKDEIIARLAAGDEEQGEEKRALTTKLEQEQTKFTEIKKVFRQMVAALEDAAKLETDLEIPQLLEQLEQSEVAMDDLKASFAFDEATLVVDGGSLRQRLEEQLNED